jgi:hypothetical protein
MASEAIQLRHEDKPVYRKALTLIGTKGDRAVNESPGNDESANNSGVDPAQTKLVSSTSA